MTIVINGAGIAGPTLAHWLAESSHDVLLIEEAPRLRSGGTVIDFWGVGYDVAERMGLIPRIKELGYQVQELRFVDGDGRTRGGFGIDVFGRMTDGRFTSLARSDLSRTIFDALNGRVEVAFGDSVTAIEEVGDKVRVTFENGPDRVVDLVVGADGLHSRVRALAFGPESAFEVPLGYHVAAFEVAGYRPRDELVYVSHGVPGRQISRFAVRGDRTIFLFVFRDEYLTAGPGADTPSQKAELARVFGDVGWECPRILEAMEDSRDFYFDTVSQIKMDRWARGRVALVGDAAACVSLLAGEGTGLAMAEAYVLAGELARTPGDVNGALARYQQRLMPFLRGKQRSAQDFASSFAPRTAFGLTFRNFVSRLLGVPALADWIFRSLRDDFELPTYPS